MMNLVIAMEGKFEWDEEKNKANFKKHNIQLPAFRRNHKTLESVRGDTFFTWLYLLDKGYQNESEMEVLSTMSEGMENFAARYHIAINDPRLKRLYRMQQDAEREEATRLSVAVTKAENRQNREHAKVLKECGVDPAIISRATGLSPDEIAQL